jgi:hypothetical protein
MGKRLSKKSFRDKLRKASLRSLNEQSDHPEEEPPRVELSTPLLEDIRDPYLYIRDLPERTLTENQSRVDKLLRAALRSMKESFVFPDRS